MAFDLDVSGPDKVANVLRKAAERFAEDAAELSHSWQDPTAGKPWDMIAQKLEACANSIERELKKMKF